MMALRKIPGPEWMSEKNMFHNPEAKVAAEKVVMEIDPVAEEVFYKENGLAILSHVEVEIVQDKVFREEVKYSKGTPNNPFTKEELKDKFRTLASSLFSEKRINQIIETVDNLDELDNISMLIKLLKKE